MQVNLVYCVMNKLSRSQSVKMVKKERRSNCPINFALESFGDTWSLLIVRDILMSGKMTYGDFLKSDEGIATNILADRLLRLERNGIINKISYEKDKRKDIYQLTQRGIDLLPVLLEIILWSAKYDSKTAAPKEFVEKIRSHKEDVVIEILENLYKYP